MSEENTQAQQQEQNENLPKPAVPRAQKKTDFATVLGLFLSFALIAGAIALGQSDAKFFNLPSFLIVILGTLTATSISYTGSELSQSGAIIMGAAARTVHNFSKLAVSMMDLTVIARKKGVLFLSRYENQTVKEPFLNKAIGMVVDGYNAEKLKPILQQEIDLEEERQKRAASILRRASEVAPAMGLIGTLVGLVQMLADLENPETIGPAMAIALLTTFYGAILGTVVMAPLAAKIEKNAADEVLLKTMVLRTVLSILSQENPRALEMNLNALLQPSQRIKYFD